MSVAFRLGGVLPRRDLLVAFVAVCIAEAALLGAYLVTSSGYVTEPRYLVYPFVWLNAAGLALALTNVPDATTRRHLLATGVGVGYFLVLAVVDGTIAFGHGTGIDIYWTLPPGWGPMIVAEIGPLRFAPIPFRTVGYAAIAFLLAVAVLDVSSRAVGGLVGLFSCVSCTLPILAAVLSGVGGGALTAVAWSYDLSTAVFLVTVAVLTRWTGGASG